MPVKLPDIQPDPAKTLIAVWFKHEDHDERTDQPIGPVGFSYAEDDPRGWRPFDPNRKPDPWVGIRNARALAKKHGVELRET